MVQCLFLSSIGGKKYALPRSTSNIWTAERRRALPECDDVGGRSRHSRALRIPRSIIETIQKFVHVGKNADAQALAGDSGRAAIYRRGGVREQGGSRPSGFCVPISNGYDGCI